MGGGGGVNVLIGIFRKINTLILSAPVFPPGVMLNSPITKPFQNLPLGDITGVPTQMADG